VQPSRILLTGAGGFVGRHLAPVLAAAFPQATLLGWGGGGPDIDITDDQAVADQVRNLRPDVCVHLAAISATAAAQRDPRRAWRVNLQGTLHLADALLRHAPDCLLVFASSADAYGRSFRTGTPLDESAPLAPLSTYGATKAAADLALGALAHDGLRVVRVRPFNHAGPGQSPDFVLPAFARQLARIEAGLQEPRIEVGSLDPRRDFLDVRDVCAGYAAIIAAGKGLVPGSVFNLASGVSRRIGDVLDEMIALASVKPEVETGSHLLRAADITAATGDATAARAAFGWAPAIPWSETLRDVMEDWRARVRQ